MFLFRIALILVLVICPWVFSCGQLHFASVNGERGYAAMRGDFRMDLDNGFVLVPAVGYYRMSDTEEDESGATTKFAFSAEYEAADNLKVIAGASYIPLRLGFQNVAYGAGVRYTPCYRCAGMRYPYVSLYAGQTRYKIDAYSDGRDLPGRFKTYSTAARAEAGGELGKFFFQARYEKVIKYKNKPSADVAANWTEIPFMTAVVQGFVSDAAAARVAYRTRWISPYAAYARYKYLAHADYGVSAAAGLALHLGQTTLSGGVEIFEQDRTDTRKTYFSMSASTTF